MVTTKRKMLIPFQLAPHLKQQNGIYKAHVEVTPEMAKEWLKGNTGNRPKKTGYVTILARIIKEGKFVYNGDSIRFGKKKNLIDGQNRLYAVIAANKSIMTDVVIGLDKEVFDTIDQGANRNASDIAYLSGLKHYKVAGTSAKLVMGMRRGDVKNPDSIKIQPYQLTEFFSKNPQFDDVCESGIELAKGNKLFNKTFTCAFLWILSEYDWDAAYNFLDKLLNGVDIARTSPIWVFRDFVIRTKSDPMAKINQRALRAITVKVWNAHITGKEIKRIRYSASEKEAALILKK